MNFTIENVGPIKKATIEMGDLTIICGKNNTGKTYLTRSIYEFYRSFRINLSFSIKTKQTSFPFDIDLSKYAEKAAAAVRECAKKYSSAVLEDGGSLKVSIKPSEFPVYCEAPASRWKMGDRIINVKKKGSVLHIEEELSPINATETSDQKKEEKKNSFQNIISTITQHYLFEQICNDCFISDSFCVMSERNGLVHFKTHINVANAFVLNQQINNEKTIDVKIEGKEQLNRKLLPLSMSLIHALAIFGQEKTFEERKQTEFQKQFNEKLDAIVGGKYQLKDGEFFFTPNGEKKLVLSMERCSSSVESLLLLDYYVRYFSEKGDVLVIDEPELNLHPEKQRQLARFLGFLVNAGIKVFITTHSDYIIKEINTLLMLNYTKDPRMQKLQQKYEYSSSELLRADQVHVYCVEGGKTEMANVSQDVGIVIPDFDKNIREMGKMQRDILSGGATNA